MRILIPMAAALAAGAAFAQWAPAASEPPAPQTLQLHALFEQATMVDAAPEGESLGDEQVGSGTLYMHGQEVGRFGFTCTWVNVTEDDALERCAAWGEIHGDQIVFEGMSRREEHAHTWAVTGGTGRYRRARGEATVVDDGETQAFVTVRLAG